MMEVVRNLARQVKAIWGGMSLRARLLAAAGAAAVVVGLLALVIWTQAPRYEPVFTGLQPDDLRAVIIALRGRGIPFNVDEAAGAVSVPEQQVYQVRLDLATEGLPKNSVVGFEVLKETNLGLTDFERRLRYYWALQGELTRTIRTVQGVMDARVHIVIPERSLFVSEQRPATASVLLSLMPGVALARSQVQGIVHLVANSVEGLTPGNVTVVDTRGNVLSDLMVASEGGSVASSVIAEQLQLKRNYERELERSLQTTLEQIWGTGHVIARVTADLSFDTQEEKHEVFSPVVNGRSGIIRSEQRTEESAIGQSQAPAAGVPGVTSNIPGYVAQASGAGQSESQRLESTTNYEINRVERRIVMAPGRVQRLSVAVWVDGTLDPLERQRTEQLVSTAMGLQPDRGDQVSVESIQFGRAEAPAALEAQLLAARGQPAVRGVAWWLLAILMAGGVAWWVGRRMRRLRQPRVDLTVGAPAAAAQPAPSPADLERRRMREEIERLAKEHPDEFVQLLRSWLAEES